MMWPSIRHHPGAVRRHLPAAAHAQHHAAAQRSVRRALRSHLQCPCHRRFDPSRPSRVKFRAASAASILRRNVFIYAVGGIIAPFIFIKLIDLILTALKAY